MQLTSGDLACSLCASALSGCDCMERAVSTESTYTGCQSPCSRPRAFSSKILGTLSVDNKEML